MNSAHGVLALASRTVVVLWLAAGLLAFGPASSDIEVPIAELAARIRPLVEEIVTPEMESKQAAPEPPAKSTPRPAPEPVAVDGRDLVAGDSLLDGNGAFPALSSSYAEYGSFGDYARAMQSLGARFVVVQRRQIVGRIDLASGAISPEPSAAGFSPRARDYSDEPALTPATRRARDQFGAGAEVMMLVPRALDAALFGAIARRLTGLGDSPEALGEIHARYRRGADGGVELLVDGGRRFDGSTVPLDLVFDLDRVAQLGREGA